MYHRFNLKNIEVGGTVSSHRLSLNDPHLTHEHLRTLSIYMCMVVISTNLI